MQNEKKRLDDVLAKLGEEHRALLEAKLRCDQELQKVLHEELPPLQEGKRRSEEDLANLRQEHQNLRKAFHILQETY